jgi:hypothetical protein
VLIAISIFAVIFAVFPHHYISLYVYAKSQPYSWDESNFIGKRVDEISPYISDRWDDFEVKCFTVHEVKNSNGITYYMEIHYQANNSHVKIITSVKNMIIFEKNGTRLFSKTKNSSAENVYEYIIVRVLGYPFRFNM